MAPKSKVVKDDSAVQAAIINLSNTIIGKYQGALPSITINPIVQESNMFLFLGAGILAMPFAIAQTSLFFGILLILLSGTAAALGLYFQALCSTFVPVGQSSFFSISLVTHPNLSVVFDAAIATKCFGVGVSYLIIVAQLMPQIMDYFLGNSLGNGVVSLSGNEIGDHFAIFQSRVFWVTAALIIAGPLSFARRLESLKYTSVVALLAVGYLVVLVIAKFVILAGSSTLSTPPTNPSPPSDSPITDDSPLRFWVPASIPNLLSVLPVLVFAFTCHQNMFASINELVLFNKDKISEQQERLRTDSGDPSSTQLLDNYDATDPEGRLAEFASPRASESTFARIVAVSVYPAAFTYLAVGVAGYLTFGNSVNGNIMTMYDYSLSTIVGRIAIVVLVLFSYPLQVHPCRASVYNIVSWIEKRGAAGGNDDGNNDGNGSNSGPTENTSLLEQPNTTTAVAPSPSSSSYIPILPYLIITAIIIALSFVLAVKVDSLEVVLAFVGATGSTSISFILPGLFAYTLLKKVNRKSQFEESESDDDFEEKIDEYHSTFYSPKLSAYQVYKRDKLREKLALGLFIGGLFIFVVCMTINVWNLL